MDIETAAGPPIRQASEDDLQSVLASDFGGAVSLVRNYGDRLDAVAAEPQGFRVRYYDAATGRRHEATSPWSLAEVCEGFLDYFQGNWNWHGSHQWQAIE